MQGAVRNQCIELTLTTDADTLREGSNADGRSQPSPTARSTPFTAPTPWSSHRIIRASSPLAPTSLRSPSRKAGPHRPSLSRWRATTMTATCSRHLRPSGAGDASFTRRTIPACTCRQAAYAANGAWRLLIGCLQYREVSCGGTGHPRHEMVRLTRSVRPRWFTHQDDKVLMFG